VGAKPSRETPVSDTAPLYPDLAEPEIGDGSVTAIAPGLWWARMPLGGRLAAINIWLAEETDGFTVIDTGQRSDETLAAWRHLQAGLLGGRPIRRVIATHMHPDHVGMAGWLAAAPRGAELWMSRLEYFTLRTMAEDRKSAPPVAIDFYRAAGLDEGWLDTYRMRFGGYGARLFAVPDAFHAIGAGDIVTVGGHNMRCIVGTGHSPEHVCLLDEERRLLVSGDQVLPTISSNVSVYPSEPEADPLSDWLRSLAAIRGAVPDDVLVLPAHGRPFHGLHARIDHLIEGHEAGLERLHALLDEPRRAADVFPALFRRPIEGGLTTMLAVGEAIAHLHCLRTRGLAVRTVDGDGLLWWQAA
jgi:glyoxylase-like metal-dependent hydrolase (beta-lactamase superfamily II)